MRTLSRPTLSVLALALLAACEPPEPEVGPPLVAPISLRAGAWTLEVIDATMAGPCEGMDMREIVGSRLEAGLRLREDGRAVVLLDGLRMEGVYKSNRLDVSGELMVGMGGEPEVEPDPGEDEPEPLVDEDEGEGEDEGAPGDEGGGEDDDPREPDGDDPREEPVDPRPEHAATVSLTGVALRPTLFEGSLTVDYDLPDLRCVIHAEIEGAHGVDEGRPDEPVAVETGTGCDEDEDCG